MEVAYILLGWLLGMLSPAVVDRIKRRYSKNDLYRGILTELSNLQHKMVCTAHILGSGYGNYDKQFVQWCIDHMVPTEEGDRHIIATLEKQLQLSDSAFLHVREHLLTDGITGKSLKKHSLAFTELHLSELSLFSIDFQALLFELRSRLAIYNSEVEKADNYLLMTFDSSITDKNHRLIVDSLSKKYEILQSMCIRVVNQIREINNAQKI